MRLLFLSLTFLFLNVSGREVENTLPNPLFPMGTRCYILTGEGNLKSGAIEQEEITTDSIKKIDLSQGKITVFVIHGYRDGPQSAQIKNISIAYKQMCKTCNVGYMDWKPAKNYNKTVELVPVIAETIAVTINLLIQYEHVEGPFIFVGMGMGAHVAGVAAQHISGKVLRVVGLNPAGPGFKDRKDTERISRLSGKFVEVVHTDKKFGMASKHDNGHLSFYINGAKKQPACEKSKDEYCSHLLAADYYVEAMLKPGSFLGLRCRKWRLFKTGQCFKDRAMIGTIPPVGDNFTHGRYYMVTSLKGPPHGLGTAGMDYKNRTQKAGFFASIKIFFEKKFG